MYSLKWHFPQRPVSESSITHFAAELEYSELTRSTEWLLMPSLAACVVKVFDYAG